MAGELGEPGTDGETEAEAGRDMSNGQSRGQYITVSLKPGVAQVQLCVPDCNHSTLTECN